MTSGYALRGTVGGNYLLSEATTIGGYCQTAQSFTFDNTFLSDPGPGQIASDVHMDLPPNIGFGVANSALMNGRLLFGVDLVYKFWNEADLYREIYDNQMVVQVGGRSFAGFDDELGSFPHRISAASFQVFRGAAAG